MNYAFLIHQDPESGMFLVDVPDLPGVITEGRTLEEARENARRAIKSHVEFLREEGVPIPEPTKYTYDVAV